MTDTQLTAAVAEVINIYRMCEQEWYAAPSFEIAKYDSWGTDPESDWVDEFTSREPLTEDELRTNTLTVLDDDERPLKTVTFAEYIAEFGVTRGVFCSTEY